MSYLPELITASYMLNAMLLSYKNANHVLHVECCVAAIGERQQIAALAAAAGAQDSPLIITLDADATMLILDAHFDKQATHSCLCLR